MLLTNVSLSFSTCKPAYHMYINIYVTLIGAHQYLSHGKINEDKLEETQEEQKNHMLVSESVRKLFNLMSKSRYMKLRKVLQELLMTYQTTEHTVDLPLIFCLFY